jgi:steroid delta-isomerase-like uncharacterized protein
MSAAKNKELVMRYYEHLWNRWDTSAIDELIAPDIVFRGSLGTSVQGIQGFRSYVNTVRQAFPDFYNRVEELIADDDRVAARLSYSGTHAGVLLGIQPTGRSIRYAGAGFFRLANDRILEGTWEPYELAAHQRS